MKTLIINNKNDGKKLNTVLLNTYPNININKIYKALRKKDIRVNNKKVSENIIVHLGDEIKIFISDKLLFSNSLKQKSLKISDDLIIYEDSNILVFNKPIGIEVTGENSLTCILSDYKKVPMYPCHRLDRNTCGLILYAKNIKALEILLNKFKNHEIEKHYTCMVYGIPVKKSDILKAYLFKDSKNSKVFISNIPKKGYKKIITQYSIISINKKNNTCILDVILHTGRTHQIRAHLAYIGYPIIGDR